MSTDTRDPRGPHILFLGSTGYIGASVLDRLLKHKDHESFTPITLFMRSQEKAAKFENMFPVKVVIGSLEDTALLEDEAARADVVINTASADHLSSVTAILSGLKRRRFLTGKIPVYIHTSGTGVIADKSEGSFTSQKIYDDTEVEDLKESIPPTAIHRNIDLAVLAGDEAGYVRSYIVLPSTVWAIGSGPIYDAGLANAHSVQIPAIIKAALSRKRAGMVGEGKNDWPHVHVDDLADLYILLFDAIREDSHRAGHGWEGFYFAENGRYTVEQVAIVTGRELVEVGKAEDPTPTSFSQLEIDDFFGGNSFLGTNCRCRATRARQLGWQPARSTQDLLDSVKLEMAAIIASGDLKISFR